MKSRIQFSLDSKLLERSRARAESLGVPLAEHVRRLLTQDLDLAERAASPNAVFNLGSSRGSDISRRKEVMVAAAIAADRGLRRRTPKRPADPDHRS